MDKKFLIIICFLFLLPPFLQAAIPADWWGKVVINGNSGNDGALVEAYINYVKIADAVVGEYASEYYLIHVLGRTGDLVQFKVNGEDAGELQAWVFGSHRLDFSVEIEENETTEDLTENNFSDLEWLDTCENGEVGNLEIEIKNPDDKDDFNPEDIIKIKVRVKNNDDEDKKIVVEAFLYNSDEEDEVDSSEEKEKVKSNDNENFNLEIKVPDDFEEEDYIIFVKAYEKNEEESQCAQDIVEIELERKDNELKIEKIELNSFEAFQGGYLGVFVDVKNLGDDDEENIYISAGNSELGISEKVGPFEIEEFGDDDELSEILNVKIPDDAKEGNYFLDIFVEGDESEDSSSVEFKILKSEIKNLTDEKIYLTSPTEKEEINKIVLTGKTVEAKREFQLSDLSDKDYILIDATLFFAIIVVVILIVVIRKK